MREDTVKKKDKFYVVWSGREPGIYRTWHECQKQTDGFPGARYKSFKTQSEAEKAFQKSELKITASSQKKTRTPSHDSPEDIIRDSISVDAAWNTATGDMEYQAVHTTTKQLIFKQGPYSDGTNNIGEFLAIVHALAYCQKNKLDLPIYTDSVTALSWIKRKRSNTRAERTKKNALLFELIERADKWLENNAYSNKVLKWQTKAWGEIAADYGRK